MFRVLTCLTVEHDWRLVGVAAVLCLFASLAAVNLFNRARATAGRARFVWIIAAAIATGFGIWATHFVAMLAYEPGFPIAYSLSLTFRTLAAAAVITGFGLSIAVYGYARWAPVLAGAVVGGGIAAMHYTGMYAVEIPGRVTWQFPLVLASIIFGMVLGALALVVAIRSYRRRDAALAAVLLTLAIVSYHFTRWRLCPIRHVRLMPSLFLRAYLRSQLRARQWPSSASASSAPLLVADWMRAVRSSRL